MDVSTNDSFPDEPQQHPVMGAEQFEFRPYQPSVTVSVRCPEENLIARIRARAIAEADGIDKLRQENIDLRRRLAEAEQAVLAFAIMERRRWHPEPTPHGNQWRIRLDPHVPPDWARAWSASYDRPMRAVLEEDERAGS